LISRRKNFVALLEDEEFEREEQVRKTYCERCDKEYGVKALLGPRIMPLDSEGKPEQKPADYDEWLQCRGCGTMYHKQEVKQEAKLGDFVETSDNPHEDKKSEITAVYSRGRGATAKRLKQKKRKEQLDSIKDEDIKREVKMGGKVTIEEDSTAEARVFDYTVYDYYY
jgi:acetyl-CoA carboxylase beta subunit